MFDGSKLRRRYSRDESPISGLHLGYVPEVETDTGEDRRALRLAIAVAVLLHGVFFLLRLPELQAVEVGPPRERQVYVVQQIRFAPPLPPAELVPRRTRQAKKIPIPDPTPDDPEPLLVDEIEVPEVELSELADAAFGIPDGPPGPPIAGLGANGPYRPGGEVTPPLKIFDQTPKYTEEARQNRIEGVVILETVVDAHGDVARVKVLKGLPMGLTESAVETVRSWQYRPATRLGEPVAVVMNVTVRFSLQ